MNNFKKHFPYQQVLQLSYGQNSQKKKWEKHIQKLYKVLQPSFSFALQWLSAYTKQQNKLYKNTFFYNFKYVLFV